VRPRQRLGGQRTCKTRCQQNGAAQTNAQLLGTRRLSPRNRNPCYESYHQVPGATGAETIRRPQSYNAVLIQYSKLRLHGKQAHETHQESLPEAGVRIDAVGTPASLFHRFVPHDVFASVGVYLELESEGNSLEGIDCCRCDSLSLTARLPSLSLETMLELTRVPHPWSNKPAMSSRKSAKTQRNYLANSAAWRDHPRRSFGYSFFVIDLISSIAST